MSSDYYLPQHHQLTKSPRVGGRGRPWHTGRQGKIPRLGLIHTAENLPDFNPPDMAAENVARWAAGQMKVSWHDTSDSDTWIQMLPYEATGFHVRGYNRVSVGLEIACRHTDWANAPDLWVDGAIHQAARVVAHWHATLGIPIRRISAMQARAGAWGLIGHEELDPTRKRDPGPLFPWDRLLQAATSLTTAAHPRPSPEPGTGQIPSDWAVPAVEWVQAEGIMEGRPTGFDPHTPVTRQELAATLFRYHHQARQSTRLNEEER